MMLITRVGKISPRSAFRRSAHIQTSPTTPRTTMIHETSRFRGLFTFSEVSGVSLVSKFEGGSFNQLPILQHLIHFLQLKSSADD